MCPLRRTRIRDVFMTNFLPPTRRKLGMRTWSLLCERLLLEIRRGRRRDHAPSRAEKVFAMPEHIPFSLQHDAGRRSTQNPVRPVYLDQ